MKRLQSKELFLSANSDVGAVMLADSIGEAVDLGEAEELISIILEHDSTSISLEELSIVEAWISQQCSPRVVVATNSWTAYRMLKELNVGQKAELLRCHASSEEMFIFGFVTPSGIRIRRQMVGVERSTDRLLGDGRVVAAVEQLSDEDVEKIAIANPDKDEATIRGYVYVRVFESLRIDVIDPSEIAVWALPESAY
jgi:hypothetical protein